MIIDIVDSKWESPFNKWSDEDISKLSEQDQRLVKQSLAFWKEANYVADINEAGCGLRNILMCHKMAGV